MYLWVYNNGKLLNIKANDVSLGLILKMFGALKITKLKTVSFRGEDPLKSSLLLHHGDNFA